MAVVFTADFEGASPWGFDSTSGTPTKETTNPIRQTGSMKSDCSAANQWALKSVTGNAVFVTRTFFRIDALAAAASGAIVIAYNGPDTAEMQLILAQGAPNTLTLQGMPGALSPQVATINPVIGTTYRVDMRINAAANPWVVDWSIATGWQGGVSQTASQPAFASDTIANIILGPAGAGTSGTATTIVNDDFQIATGSSGDYPLAFTASIPPALILQPYIPG